MDPEALRQCQERIGYQFEDEELLGLSLTHASVAPTRLDSNERLEFLGDAVLGFVICHELYDRYDDLLEGDMTKIKSSVVSRQTCAMVARELELPELVYLGKGMSAPGKLPLSVIAAVVESIIGAVYLDGGMDAARSFVLAGFGHHLDQAVDDQHHSNFKSLLQQHAQRAWSTTPEYVLLDEKGPDHSKCFEIAVSIAGRHYPSAWGRNKKEAEQEAARRALTELGLLIEEDDESDHQAEPAADSDPDDVDRTEKPTVEGEQGDAVESEMGADRHS